MTVHTVNGEAYRSVRQANSLMLQNTEGAVGAAAAGALVAGLRDLAAALSESSELQGCH